MAVTSGVGLVNGVFETVSVSPTNRAAVLLGTTATLRVRHGDEYDPLTGLTSTP